MNRNTTLLDLVCEVSREARNEADLVQRVVTLVNSGCVRLSGSFRGVRFDDAHLGLGRPLSGRRIR